MNIFSRLEDMIENAKPHLRHGLTRADGYACRIIELLERIADDDTRTDDQRVKRFALVNGAPQTFETPAGEDWNMVALIVEPVGATTVTLRLGGVTRFAKLFNAADTPQVPATVISNGASLDLQSTGADAVVTIIASLRKHRGKIARGTTGDQLSTGFPGANELEPSRGFADEAVHIEDPHAARSSQDYEDTLAQDPSLAPPDNNATPVY